MYALHDVIAKFIDAMIAAGIKPDARGESDISADGKLVRFHVEGDRKGTRNGWAVLFGDGVPAGEFGHWVTGEVVPWCMKGGSEISAEEAAANRARIEAARAQREAERKELEGEAARQANLIWNEATPADNSHPYIVRKGILSDGKVRVTSWPIRGEGGEVIRHIDNTLIVPIQNKAGKIVSLQAIFPRRDAQMGRDKDFLKNGLKKACFYTFGAPVQGKPIAFCEGFATAASIHEATGWMVVVCWDAYNLPRVAEVWRTLMPGFEFVICADNDQWTKQPVDNPGVTYGKRACAAVNGRLCTPDFGALDDMERPTDFNDLHARDGIEAVQAQILPSVASEQAQELAPVITASNGDPYSVPGMLAAYDIATPFPDINGKGKPLSTALNLAELCRRIGVVVRYNVIKKDLEIIVPGLATSLDNSSEVAVGEIMDAMQRCGMSAANFETSLTQIADRNLYNPVANWIAAKPWDGVSRLAAFFDTVEEKEARYLPDGRRLRDVLMRKWLISAVAAAFSPDGVVARGVLTFVSKQNLGKTRWAKRLCPADMGVISDGEVLDPNNKDSVMKVISKWIVELGEVDATFRKADVAALKGFISRDHDELRKPYARKESRFARRTIFFASVNGERFLKDDTGNTRWWALHAVRLGDPSKLDMQQVWAEIKTLFDAGEEWHLAPDELDALNDSNQNNHEELSPLQELIDRNFDWGTPQESWIHPYRATEIVHSTGNDRPTKMDVNTAAQYVTKRYGVQTKVMGKERCKMWLMPTRSATRGTGTGPL